VHVLDLAPLDGSDPVANFETVERELALHDARLAELPRILALSKADLVAAADAAAAATAWRGRLAHDVPVVVTSSATRHGLDELTTQLLRAVPLATHENEEPEVTGPQAGDLDVLAEHRVFRPAPARAFHVTQLGDGRFEVSGAGVERIVARYDLENEDALAHLERRLRGIGVIRALEAAGFEPGDDVEIAGVVFELDPS
jgi:GTP-binding protein